MAKITSEAEFQVLKWERGQGYYNAHKHKLIYPWCEFKRRMGKLELSIVKRRYEAYVMSWIMFHKIEPDPEDLDDKHGTTILAKVETMIEGELHRIEGMQGAKRKK